jgi:hypothetical protein
MNSQRVDAQTFICVYKAGLVLPYPKRVFAAHSLIVD